MADTWVHAERYRSSITSEKDVRALAKSVYASLGQKTKSKFTNIAVVFAFVGEQTPEFALVTNHWSDKQVKKDMEVMLTYGDPIGIVGVASGEWDKDRVIYGSTQEFQTFKGKEWAAKYADTIIEQANDVIPIVRLA